MAHDLKPSIGFTHGDKTPVLEDRFLIEYVNLRLAATGLPHFQKETYPFMELTQPLLKSYRQSQTLLEHHLCPADQRIQNFINAYFSDARVKIPEMPCKTLVLDRHGMSRILSMPLDRDEFSSDIVTSYRLAQGILHNPKSDRRTTVGTFHIVEGGLPIPDDKIAVSKAAFAYMLDYAFNQAPKELLQLPFTDSQEEKAATWVSILLRPMVCPEVEGVTPRKTMETRFFVPGNLVCNLDFVESIFGNAGDPSLPENDAALDVEHWTGHTGCVILAPHLTKITKKELGLPHVSKATERQKRDRQCWEQESELYNDGNAFKLTLRDHRGVVITLIADNYFGYCKKEVKTQISYATNLYGQTEEEHAGGAIAFPSYDLAEDFMVHESLKEQLRYDADHTFEKMCALLGDSIEVHPEGYAIDKQYSSIYYVPEDAYFTLIDQTVSWQKNGVKQSMGIRPGIIYMLPFGYKVEMVQPQPGRRWRLIGSTAEGTYCHKPCTVSGGGKSEISKSATDSVVRGPVFVADFEKDMNFVEEIVNRNFGNRFKDASLNRENSRGILSFKRTLGSVIKLLTPHEDYTDEHNHYISHIPHHIKQLVFVLKRVYKPDWGDDWRRRFTVDTIDGTYGNELKFKDQKLAAIYMRVGFREDGSWRTFGLRKDYSPALKLQMEDDITASVVVPADKVKYLDSQNRHSSVKFSENCEYRLFQRPDEAIHRGYDKATEKDMAQPANFISNFEPLTRNDVKTMIEDTIQFERFSDPMKQLLSNFAESEKGTYVVSSANPRIVDGKPTKNPRFLQDRGDLQTPREYYLSDVATRLYRRIPLECKVPRPVNAVLPGRRNNPPEGNIRSLAVFNPIHYMPLPELFMEFISSMTGKSPSTTGAGSEGALTKGPFNMLCPVTDINNALVSFLITGHHAFITAAGYVGPNYRVDHDISLLVPELWCRMREDERDPAYLIKNGFLEKCEDVEHDGKTIRSSLLGYRITKSFVIHFFGRVFGNPGNLFEDEMLRPELQSMDIFADGMENICVTHKRVADLYFADGSIDNACPPIYALLHIMAHGHYEGKDSNHADIRKLFTRESMLSSDWYRARLEAFQKSQEKLWNKHLAALKSAQASKLELHSHGIELDERIAYVEKQISEVGSKGFVDSQVGTLGLDPCVLG